MAFVAGVDVTTGDIITAANWNNYLGVAGSIDYLKGETDKLAAYQRAIATSNQIIEDTLTETDITGLSISLTPTASDFILLTLQIPAFVFDEDNAVGFRLYRDAVQLQYLPVYPASVTHAHSVTMVFLDIPGAGTFDYKATAKNGQNPGKTTLGGSVTAPMELVGILFGV